MVVCFLFFKEEEIRIRVVANSDNPVDIKEKEEVVDYLKNHILQDKKIDDEYLSNNYLMIEKELNKVFDNIKVSYENHTFYNKTYNGSVLADGTYKTLLIEIENGSGSNWWSSVYGGKIHDGEEVNYQWFFQLDGE